MESDTDPTGASYSRVADEYTRQFLGEFAHKPGDRALLDRFAARVAGRGRAADLGCGPGQLARYLHERGVDVVGIDLSAGMVAQARQAHPGIAFRQGDMRALDLPDAALAGIAAFYSIIHIPRADVPAVLRELRRVLQPGGLLLLAFHRGAEVVHREEWWGQPIALDFTFFEPDEMAGYLRDAGFTVEEIVERPPYPEVEYPSRRVYISAVRPAAGPAAPGAPSSPE